MVPVLGKSRDGPKEKRDVSFTIGGNEEDCNRMGQRATQGASFGGCELCSGAEAWAGNAMAAWRGRC